MLSCDKDLTLIIYHDGVLVLPAVSCACFHYRTTLVITHKYVWIADALHAVDGLFSGVS